MHRRKPLTDQRSGRCRPGLGARVAALLAWHLWLTLALFGDDPWETLFNDQPIVSGAHPQKLYLGRLGAQGIVTQGRTTVYDLSNLAGYPKTPIFDGARLAELLLLLGGGSYQPAAYKVGFAGLCMLVPIFLLLTCKSLELGHGTSLLATFLGQLIWWGPHGRTALVTGDCELYLAVAVGPGAYRLPDGVSSPRPACRRGSAC